MPDSRRHRGPDHADRSLFAEGRLPELRDAVGDLSWLMGRGYSEPSALKIVGDRYQLRRRQREALRRASCSDAALAARSARSIPPGEIGGLRVDGFNVIITIEAAISGGVLFACRDGCLRDIASIHGSYRQVDETRRAVESVGLVLEAAGAGPVTWYLDSPVSNSGRLGRLMRSMAEERGWPWEVALVKNPDNVLVEAGEPVATSDAPVLDACGSWLNLARWVVESGVPGAWVVDLVESS
jgi:hypothetical protein